MDWAIFFTILGGTAAVIGCLYQFLRNFKTDINESMEKINDHLDKVDKNIDRINNRLDGHAMRIDQLYKIIVDLLQQRK